MDSRDIGAVLAEQIRVLEEELARTKAALAAYKQGRKNTPPPVPTQPPAPGSPTLDNIPIGDATRVYLEWAQSHGRGSVEAGEIFDAISAHRVMTARDGRYLSQLTNPWRSYSISLGASPNFYADLPKGAPIRRQTPVKLGRRSESSSEK